MHSTQYWRLSICISVQLLRKNNSEILNTVLWIYSLGQKIKPTHILLNQSINQSINTLFSVEQSVTEYMWEDKSKHKIYKKKIERLAYSVQEFNTYY